MDFLIGLAFLILLGILMWTIYLGVVNSAASLAKEVIKAAIRESRDDISDWDDTK